eukprot:gene5535-4169_t
MDALLTVLASKKGIPGVQQLLSCLDQDFQLDVVICSYGGVGSTELSNFLNQHGLSTNLLTDQDNLRHCPRPPTFGLASAPAHEEAGPSCSISDGGARAQPRTVVCLYGNPLASIASHYRRGHAYHQSLKTSGGATAKIRSQDFPTSFEDYVAKGEDLFGYEQHLQNWLEGEANYTILYVRYEHMFDLEVCQQLFKQLCSHCKAEDDVLNMAQTFSASKRERKSQAPSGCSGMYSEMIARLNTMPYLGLRHPSSKHIVSLVPSAPLEPVLASALTS